MCEILERELVSFRFWSTFRAWLLLGGLGVVVVALHVATGPSGTLSTAVLAGAAAMVVLALYSERVHRHRARARLVDRAAAMLRHEINNQLQIVMANLEELGHAAERERVCAALRAVQRVANILNDLSLERVRAFDPRHPDA